MSDSAAKTANRSTLQRVLSRSFTLVGLLGVAVALLAVLATSFALQREYARDNIELLARQAAYSSEVPMVFNDMHGAREALQPIVNSGNVATVLITNAAGELLLRIDRGTALPGSRLLPAALIPEPVEAPIYSAGARIGTIRIVSSGQGVGRLLIAAVVGSIACILLIVAGTIAVARRLNRTLVAPLHAIAEVANAVRADGNFARRTPSAKIAEVDELASGFNAMLSKLEDWQGQIASTHEALLHRASYDLLSGLPNRSTFVENVRDAIHAAARSKDNFALLFLDGDRFKDVNDQYGHAAGDRVIAEVAARITPLLRVGDVAARLGGDEFAILIHHLEEDADAGMVADRIGEAISSPIALGNHHNVSITMSIGIAIYPDDGTDVDTLIKSADDRMYRLKNARRLAS